MQYVWNMISKGPIAFIFFLFLFYGSASAQQDLPYFSGIVDDDNIILSWNCQYSSVKEIAVLRSADSTSNFFTIGYVDKLKKGPQTFSDLYPAPGKNYYKLCLVFKSGLKWSTGFCAVTFNDEDTVSAPKLPPVPTRMPVSGDGMAPANAILRPIVETTAKQPVSPPKASPNTPQSDTTKQQPVKLKLNTAFEDMDSTTMNTVRSRFLSTDPTSGHIKMELPADVAEHHYSIKFYNKQNHLVVDIPFVNKSTVIIDKRNFQRKGTYKFKLRRDLIELEAGSVTIY